MKKEKKHINSIWYIVISILSFVFVGFSIAGLASTDYPSAQYSLKFTSLFFLGVLGIVCIVFSMVKDSCKKENKEKEGYFDNLKQKYDGLIKIVEEKQKSFIESLKEDDESCSLFTFKPTFAWLQEYQDRLDFVKEERIRGTPDSFIEAACLINAIIEKYCLEIEYDSVHSDVQSSFIYNRLTMDFNLEIAFEVAFEMISNPKTFVEVSNGNWVESSNKKVIIQVPDGIIEKNPLFSRIKRSIYKDYIADCPISEMQLANMLHLLYLYCRDCKKE